MWCTFCSYDFSPSVLLRLDVDGHATNYFVNFGHMLCLKRVETPQGSYILAGGINNEYNCAMLAVLREGGASGHSPETQSAPQCEGCPPGEPFRYFLFPRSEVNQALAVPYNGVGRILVDGERMQIMTDENLRLTGQWGPLVDWARYDFSRDFIPQAVSFSDDYGEDHRKFSEEGKIKHPVDKCPEQLKPITVRMWSPEAGWKDVQLPPIVPRTLTR
jgi:hypothetical protein